MLTLELVAELATAAGVLIAGWQIRLVQRQARSQFEDSLVQQYREIMRRIPIEAFLDRPLSDHAFQDALPAFFHYFDLCNEQAFLRKKNRISRATWNEWREGILGNLKLRAFRAAWLIVSTARSDIFDELRDVIGVATTEHTLEKTDSPAPTVADPPALGNTPAQERAATNLGA